VSLDPLAGHVVVLAGPGAQAAAGTRALAVSTGAALLGCGMLVATVTNDNGVIDELERSAAAQGLEPPVSWRADPGVVSTWDRLYPHIEQRLGPVDAVVTDAAALDLVESVFRPDMRRRGHGAIVALSPAENPVEQIRRQLHRTQ
jgi:hypothetical protein